MAWASAAAKLKARLGPKATAPTAKSADWKVAVATMLKRRTTAPNLWLADHLGMGSPSAVSRLTVECRQGHRANKAHKALTARR